jgi:hypothetical protein
VKEFTDLELCKKFAELEGVGFDEFTGGVLLRNDIDLGPLGYNPITDLSLNCVARDKYGVSINHDFHFICIDNNIKCGEIYKQKEDIPRAVILCILKSESKV